MFRLSSYASHIEQAKRRDRYSDLKSSRPSDKKLHSFVCWTQEGEFVLILLLHAASQMALPRNASRLGLSRRALEGWIQGQVEAGRMCGEDSRASRPKQEHNWLYLHRKESHLWIV